ncbi:type II secretion system protein GspM [Brevundimonas sp.]|uniref:type II secretion system protein GspM n=1 Tax=Brevundimonas sp. TaxID=1871086 RepID=UPI00289E64A4|nr:type II secretion system protein GspM [Brevundimonas sp.]
MNAMIQSIGLWWGGRSVREQRMLAVMGLLIAAVLIWLLIVRPAFAWREAAAERRVEASASLTRIEAGLAARTPAKAATPMPLADVEQAARAAAEAAGLTVALTADEAGAIGFDASGVTSAALFGWLAALKAEYGVETRGLTVIENADASLDASGRIGG